MVERMCAGLADAREFAAQSLPISPPERLKMRSANRPASRSRCWRSP